MDETKQNESKERAEKFMEGYKKLVEEHQCDFAQYPVYVIDDKGFFKLTIQSQLVDLTQLPKPSPFIAEE